MKPPAPRSLDEEILQAHHDSRHEPALLQKLLTVALYVHSPLGPRTGRLNICMFDRPDGLRVIPVFTDIKKAKKAGRGRVVSVPVQGRVLFEATRGATLMINPNDVSCTLYPEEIDGLLESGAVAHVASFTVGEEEEVRIGAPTTPSDALAACLAQTLSGLHVAERAYWASPTGGGGSRRWLGLWPWWRPRTMANASAAPSPPRSTRSVPWTGPWMSMSSTRRPRCPIGLSSMQWRRSTIVRSPRACVRPTTGTRSGCVAPADSPSWTLAGSPASPRDRYRHSGVRSAF